MQRPVEYDNLIKTKAFEATAPTPGALAGFLRNAADYKTSAEALDPARHLQIFTLAYEGYFQIVQAVLEFYEVRTKDVRQVSVRARGQELIVAPIGHTWDSFFLNVPQVSDDFLPERADQFQ